MMNPSNESYHLSGTRISRRKIECFPPKASITKNLLSYALQNLELKYVLWT
jgi:hypothetical protein